MLRVCPRRDAICPHGMECPYTIDAYSCRSERPMKAPEQEPRRVALKEQGE